MKWKKIMFFGIIFVFIFILVAKETYSSDWVRPPRYDYGNTTVTIYNLNDTNETLRVDSFANLSLLDIYFNLGNWSSNESDYVKIAGDVMTGNLTTLNLTADTATFSGRVGIGTATPNVCLEVVDSNATIRLTDLQDKSWNIGDRLGGIELFSSDTGQNKVVASIDFKHWRAGGSGHTEPTPAIEFSLADQSNYNLTLFMRLRPSGELEIFENLIFKSDDFGTVFGLGEDAKIFFNGDNLHFDTFGNGNFRFLSGNIGVGLAPQADKRLFSRAPDGQSTIIYGIKGDTLSDGTHNYGVFGDAKGTLGINNYGVWGQASGATNNYGFYNGGGDNYLGVGKTGIGTLTPSAKLDVDGNVSLNNTLFVTEDGMVGIGTANPQRELEVSDNSIWPTMRLSGSNSVGVGMELQPSGTGGLDWSILASADGATQGGGKLGFLNNISVTKMLIDSNGNVGIGTTTPHQALEVNGLVNITQTTGNSTFYSDVIILGTIHGGSPPRFAGINITNNIFMLKEDSNSSSRFSLQNINSGSNATTIITAENDVGSSMSIGIGSSKFMLGEKSLGNITVLLSKSMGATYFANFYNEPFRWMLNPQNDGNASNLVEVMRLDENTLNVSVNITAENVFLPQYIFSHTNATIPIRGANVWTNVTFDQEDADVKSGVLHTAVDYTNNTFIIMEDGIYNVDYDFDVEDTSVGASDIDVAGRLILTDGSEVLGSVFETDITKQGAEVELSHNFLVECRAGEAFIFQFIADDGDVQISTHGTFGEHPESASVLMYKIANIP